MLLFSYFLGQKVLKINTKLKLSFNHGINIMAQKRGIQEIFEEAQAGYKPSLFKLLDIGRQKGFQTFINRKLIWPFLLDLDNQNLKKAPVYEWKGGMNRNSTDYEQLQKDADRSLSSMKTFESITKFHLRKKQEAVLAVLDSFFAKNPELRYIQGFHDVASIFLILFGNSTGYYLMQKAGRTYFYDFLTFDFGEVGMAVSKIVFEIVTAEDPEFKKIYANYEHTQFLTFILPWVLTWFSHNFSSVKMICRIWDYLLCTGPSGVFYFTCGIILSTKRQLLAQCEELDEPTIQTFYQEQAKNSTIDIQKAIRVAFELEEKYDISALEGYKRLEENSMFRQTTFYKSIPLHKEYHENRKKNQMSRKTKEKLLKGALVVGTVAILFFAFKATKNPEKFFSHFSGEM